MSINDEQDLLEKQLRAEIEEKDAQIMKLVNAIIKAHDMGQFICSIGMPDDPVEYALIRLCQMREEMEEMARACSSDFKQIKELKDNLHFYYCLACDEQSQERNNCGGLGGTCRALRKILGEMSPDDFLFERNRTGQDCGSCENTSECAGILGPGCSINPVEVYAGDPELRCECGGELEMHVTFDPRKNDRLKCVECGKEYDVDAGVKDDG